MKEVVIIAVLAGLCGSAEKVTGRFVYDLLESGLLIYGGVIIGRRQ